MAVVLVEGFDHYATATAPEKFWNGVTGIVAPGRGFGGQCLDVIADNDVSKELPSTYSTLIAGAAIKLTDNQAGTFMALWGPGGPQVQVALSVSQRLQLLNAAGSVVATGTTIVPLNSWFYVELKVVVGVTGTAEVHLNGASEITSSSGNYAATNVDQLRFENHSLSGNTFVDDVVVLDTTGSSPQNTFLGDVRVETLFPVADGSYTAWTPDSGTSHYQRVDEHQIDGDTSYVKTATATNKDSYLMDTFLTTIYTAQLNIGARKGEAALRQFAPLIRQSGTDYFGATATLSLNYLFYSWTLGNDPTGSAWTATTINADEFGQKLVT